MMQSYRVLLKGGQFPFTRAVLEESIFDCDMIFSSSITIWKVENAFRVSFHIFAISCADFERIYKLILS